MTVLWKKLGAPLLCVMIHSALSADDATLASPVFPLLEPESYTEMEEAIQTEKPIMVRDDESLSCSERFPEHPPNCMDESQPIYVKHPIGTECQPGYTQKLADAGDCESPCSCDDVPKSSEKYSRGKRSVVTCTHSRTTWECRKVSQK